MKPSCFETKVRRWTPGTRPISRAERQVRGRPSDQRSALPAITPRAEELEVLCGVRPAHRDRNDVVELSILGPSNRQVPLRAGRAAVRAEDRLVAFQHGDLDRSFTGTLRALPGGVPRSARCRAARRRGRCRADWMLAEAEAARHSHDRATGVEPTGPGLTPTSYGEMIDLKMRGHYARRGPKG
jgi:hypothetical protein